MRGWNSIFNRHANMFTLIALGVGAAYIFSVAATLAPGIFRRASGSTALSVLRSPALIRVLVLLGQTSSAIR